MTGIKYNIKERIEMLAHVSQFVFLFTTLLFIVPSLTFLVDKNTPTFASQNKILFVAICTSLSALWLVINRDFRLLPKVKIRLSELLFSTLVISLVLFLSLLFANYFHDLSWDGRAYHQAGIWELANGWNPIHGKPLDEHLFSNFKWVNEYPKSWWITLAQMKWLGSIESLKIFYPVLSIATLFTCSKFLLEQGQSPFASFFLSLGIILNPVLVGQITTFYLDGMLYLVLVQLIISTIWLVKDQSTERCILWVCLFVYLANLKFTGLVYASTIIILLFLFIFLFKPINLNLKKIYGAVAIAGTLTYLCGWNPYVKNLLEGRHLFFPVMGAGSIDIISNMVPFQEANFNKFISIKKFLIANVPYDGSKSFIVRLLELPLLTGKNIAFYVDPRTLGFGEFFAPTLFASLLLGISFLFDRKSIAVLDFKKLLFFLGCIGALFINPQSWWARYSPQVWLIPFAMPLVLIRKHQNLWSSMSGKLYSSILILLVYIPTARIVRDTFSANEKHKQQRMALVERILQNADKKKTVYFASITYSDLWHQVAEYGFDVKMTTFDNCQQRKTILLLEPKEGGVLFCQ